MLAERIEESVNVGPEGYIMLTACLMGDCKKETGISGFGEPMPSQLRGVPASKCETFRNVLAVDLARGAFGDPFANQVLAFQRSITTEP